MSEGKTRKPLELWLVLGVSICVLLASVLGFLAPYGFFFEMFAEFRRPLLFLSGPLVLLVGMLQGPRRLKWASATASILAAAIQLIVLGQRPYPDSKPGTGIPFKVLQANLYKGNGDLVAIQKLLNVEDVSLLALFEVRDLHAPFLEEAAKSFPYASKSGDSLILSRLPMSPVLQRGLTIEDRTNFVRVETVNGPLIVALVHPTIPMGPKGMAARNYVLWRQAKQLATLPSPKILVGDFNTTRASHAFAETQRLSGCRDTTPYGANPTWNAKWPGMFRISLDHLLASPDIGIASKRLGPAINSDHLPVITELELPSVPWNSQGKDVLSSGPSRRLLSSRP